MSTLSLWLSVVLWMFQNPASSVIPGGGSTLISPPCYGLVCSNLGVDASAFSWVNQGTATTTVGGTYVVIQDTDTGGDQMRMRVMAAPATPYTLTMGVIVHGIGGGSSGYTAGGVVRQSSDGKLIVAGKGHVTNINYSLIQKFTNATTFSANVLFQTFNAHTWSDVVWIRYADNGTNRTWSFSADGVAWNTVQSETRTTFLTADQLGFFVNAFDSNASTTLVYWRLE